jgi:hypothetical protein
MFYVMLMISDSICRNLLQSGNTVPQNRQRAEPLPPPARRVWYRFLCVHYLYVLQIYGLKINTYIYIGFKKEIVTPFVFLFLKPLRCIGVNRPVVTMNLSLNIYPALEQG